MGNTCKPMAVSFQCMTKFTTNIKNKKKIKWGEKGMTKDETVGWHHDGHEFKKALEVGDGQGSLACCSPWGRKESDMTE